MQSLIEFIERPYIKWALPIPVLLALAPVLWFVFRATWKDLEDDALAWRQELRARGTIDLRPAVALLLAVFVLTLQEYFGRYTFFETQVLSWLYRTCESDPQAALHLQTYGQLYGRIYWGGMRFLTYGAPLLAWRWIFPGDSILDMGLRTRGLQEHAWIYALCVAVMIPILYAVARQPDFGQYYPIHGGAGRSWLDFCAWEAAYLAQFLGLEAFFRGFLLRACRSLGIGAIFAMVVPYAMIHFGKPYHEVAAALVAGTILGSLAMKTKSIWAGLLVHASVAVLMDILALDRKGQLPLLLAPGSTRRLAFSHWHAAIWILWIAAMGLVVFSALKRRDQIRTLLFPPSSPPAPTA